jgi:hypothetical protein
MAEKIRFGEQPATIEDAVEAVPNDSMFQAIQEER